MTAQRQLNLIEKMLLDSRSMADRIAAHFFVATCSNVALAGTQSILDRWSWRLAITDDGVRYGPTFGQACARDWRLNGHWLLPRTRMRESWLQPDRGCRRGAHRKGGRATAQSGCRGSSYRSGSRHGGGSRSTCSWRMLGADLAETFSNKILLKLGGSWTPISLVRSILFGGSAATCDRGEKGAFSLRARLPASCRAPIKLFTTAAKRFSTPSRLRFAPSSMI